MVEGFLLEEMPREVVWICGDAANPLMSTITHPGRSELRCIPFQFVRGIDGGGKHVNEVGQHLQVDHSLFQFLLVGLVRDPQTTPGVNGYPLVDTCDVLDDFFHGGEEGNEATCHNSAQNLLLGPNVSTQILSKQVVQMNQGMLLISSGHLFESGPKHDSLSSCFSTDTHTHTIIHNITQDITRQDNIHAEETEAAAMRHSVPAASFRMSQYFKKSKGERMPRVHFSYKMEQTKRTVRGRTKPFI